MLKTSIAQIFFPDNLANTVLKEKYTVEKT